MNEDPDSLVADACGAESDAPATEAEASGETSSDTVTSDESAGGHLSPEGGPEIAAESIIEAIVFASDSPLPAARIAQILGFGDARVVKKHVAELNRRYEREAATFRIEELAGGFQMLTLPAYHKWIAKLHSVRRETRLSGAAMETLAVVAYKQPVLRADIESVRGVAVGDILNRLREMGLVKIVGRAEIIGRPMLYGTTRKFLQVFGLASLEDLPKVETLPPPPGTPRPTETCAPQPPKQIGA